MSTSIRSDQPLGPVNYQFEHDTRSLPLLDIHEPFLTALQTEPRLISGRKGSGKTTVLYAHQFYDDLLPRLRRIRPEPNARKELQRTSRHVLVISTHREFEPIVESVFRRAYDGGAGQGKTTETLRDEWEDRLWYQIISYFYSLHVADPYKRAEERFKHVIAYCDRNFRRRYVENSYLEVSDSVSPEEIARNILRNAQQEVISHLESEKRKCFLLLDALEEYPIHNEKWLAVVRGFLPALEAIQAKYHPHINIMATIPEEIEYIFREQPGNEPGKNFSSIYRVRWTAKDLKRIVAHRFIQLIKEIVNEDSLLHSYFVQYDLRVFENLIKITNNMDINSHRAVDNFLSKILPDSVTNRIGIVEELWPYVIRHTHICPRHLLLILNEAIVSSGDYWRRYGKLNEASILHGVSNAEKIICPNVCVPYQSIYPEILSLVRIFCQQLPSFFGYKELSKMANVLGRQLIDPIADRQIGRDGAARLLFNMGIVGRIEGGKEGGRIGKYEETRYSYTSGYSHSSEGVPELSDRYEYCLHPAFSGLYEARDRNRGDKRLSYPEGVEV